MHALPTLPADAVRLVGCVESLTALRPLRPVPGLSQPLAIPVQQATTHARRSTMAVAAGLAATAPLRIAPREFLPLVMVILVLVE